MPQPSLDFGLAEATDRERFALVLSAWEIVKERAKPSPMVRTVARQLLGWIHDGGRDRGLERTVREFGSRFECSRATIQRALAILIDGGIVRSEAKFRSGGDQGANVYWIRWEGVQAIAVQRGGPAVERLLERGQGGASTGYGGASSSDPPVSGSDGGASTGRGARLSAEAPFPTDPTDLSTASPTPDSAAAAAAIEREWQSARRDLVELLRLTAPKAAEAIRDAKRDGYGPQEVRLLIGICVDQLANGKLTSPGSIVYRLLAPPGSPPLENWPKDLLPPRPRSRPSTNDPTVLAERERCRLIDRIVHERGLSRLDAADEADRWIEAAKRSRTEQGAIA